MTNKKYLIRVLVGISAMLLLVACNKKASVESGITVEPWGKTADREVLQYTLKNKNGMKVQVINYGGIITRIEVPDKKGAFQNITLGFDSLSGYLADDPFLGALVGRYGNRIAKGKFTLNGTEYTLPINNAPNHLHGGANGYYTVFWEIEPVKDAAELTLKLSYLSKDGEAGYPGNLTIQVLYTLSDQNELKISYSATTDKPTVLGLTQHAYFNLSGNFSEEITDHLLTINADRYLPVDSTMIPTGELRKVENSPFDFRTATEVGKRIADPDTQLISGNGYDHCWIFDATDKSLKNVASLYETESGRYMEVWTTEPAMQFYSGNWLNEKLIGNAGIPYKRRTGLCLETQHYPDSPNHPEFPTTVLNPGETYSSQTVYKFSVK